MPSKYRIILEIASQTARDITSNADRYTDFLITAANNYKYSFKEQLLIHAQKPDATACAEIDTWNKLGRWVLCRPGCFVKEVSMISTSSNQIDEIVVPDEIETYVSMPSCLLQGCSNDLIIFRADGGNHFTHYGIYEGMFLIFDVSKDFKDGHLSCYLNNSGDDRPKFKVSDKPLDGYRHLGRLVASMKNYEV